VLTASTATAQARHAGGEAGLIDEDQALRIEVGLRGKPRLARLGHVGAILLGCMRRLFFHVTARRAKKRHSVPNPTETLRSVRRRSCISASVMSLRGPSVRLSHR